MNTLKGWGSSKIILAASNKLGSICLYKDLRFENKTRSGGKRFIFCRLHKFERDASMIVWKESRPKANGTPDRFLYSDGIVRNDFIVDRWQQWCWIQDNAISAELFVANILDPLYPHLKFWICGSNVRMSAWPERKTRERERLTISRGGEDSIKGWFVNNEDGEFFFYNL